jgi:hypothetical protein
MWGTGLLIEVGIRPVAIADLSVDAANGLNSAITLPVIGLLVLATVVVGRRDGGARRGRRVIREQTAPPKG